MKSTRDPGRFVGVELRLAPFLPSEPFATLPKGDFVRMDYEASRVCVDGPLDESRAYCLRFVGFDGEGMACFKLAPLIVRGSL